MAGSDYYKKLIKSFKTTEEIYAKEQSERWNIQDDKKLYLKKVHPMFRGTADDVNEFYKEVEKPRLKSLTETLANDDIPLDLFKEEQQQQPYEDLTIDYKDLSPSQKRKRTMLINQQEDSDGE